MTPPTTLLDRVRLRLRSRRRLERALAVAEGDRDGARAVALGWQREARAAQAHASHWRRNVGELVGWQSEGRTDGELHRRLQQIVADGTLATEVADRARDDEEAAYEAVRRVANALRPGCKGFRADDVVAWAEEAASPDSLLASRETLLRQAEQFEAELIAVDEALAKAGVSVEAVSAGRTDAIAVLADADEKVLLRAERAEGQADALVARAERAEHELDAIRAELRATDHRVGDPRGLSYDVDIAIDVERERGQDLVERLAEVLGWRPHRSSWPHAAPHLVRAVATRLGKPMPRWRPHRNAWPLGSRMARALACTCRGDRGQGPTSIVDPQCPEHSPGYRFGGWPVQPLALPPGTAAAPSRYGLDALDRLVGDGLAGEWVCDACGRSVGVLPCPEHQPRAYAEALAEVPF